MTSVSEQELYFQARNRCLERLVGGNSFRSECLSWFLDGIELIESEALRRLTSTPPDVVVKNILSETNSGFSTLCGVLAKFEAVKGKGYQASWMKKGSESIVANIQRKFDLVDARMHGNEVGEGLITNLADLAVYCIKAIAWKAELSPDEMQVWLKEVRKTCQ